MNSFQIMLAEVEAKWFSLLYNNVKDVFADEHLPSHNESHHLRVWNYAKTLLTELSLRGISLDTSSLEEIMIAVFFHDTGMSINRNPDHGKDSRRFCEEWMDRQHLPRDEKSKKILDAIEFHDNKSYADAVGLSQYNRVNLLSLLNICDDLDAFSYCGIYRYCEIYLLRGVTIDELGQQVISNASSRFGNFMKNCMHLPVMIKTHAPRYEVLENFFRQYNAQLRKDPSGRTIDHGPVQIVKIFYRQILSGIDPTENLCSSEIAMNEGMYEKTFFENLKREWCGTSGI